MKYLGFLLALTFLSSCNQNSKKNEQDISVISSDSLTDKEADYLKTRDAYIEQFKPLQKAGLDTLNKMEDRAMHDLEVRLREILKDSKYSAQGNISLVTLLGYLGFGMLDGLSFEKDSMRIDYTSKNLFVNYFGINPSGKLSPNELETIFNKGILWDAFTTNFFQTKIISQKDVNAYGMIGQVGNMSGPSPPQTLFALVATDKYVYIIKKEVKPKVKELLQCKEVWDSFGTEVQRSVEKYDTAFEHYRRCYQKEFKNDPQFESIKKQLEVMVKYIES
ncbi:MAG TPA: hypothetical protein DGG95_09550 [Cytophagales bacterium]|nr:hypothetical protein [Cytophagales bacterium]